ncbi:MAG: type 1 glutamine amidotransferase [Chloroflexi bacterium]|nr:type 1 glutamine amidotransferase [Chloroflexota bacterium]
MTIKILLLQARHADDAARMEERASFAQMAGVDETAVIPFDLLTDTLTLADIRRYDALMVGGSGDYYVSKGNLPNFQAVLDLLSEVVAVGHPTFASCFGFQMLVQALDGEIVYAPDEMEVGTFDLQLLAAGREDDLFRILPDAFAAQLGRKDKASQLPDGVLHLAASQNAQFQAIRIPNQPIWATQFHPELTKETNLARFRRYMEGYASVKSPQEIQAMFDQFDHSPEANQLIGKFMRLVFG